ncbi:MAG: hypothetical protein ACKVOO_11635 [Burkholderiaceae bacterium]
MHLDRLFRTKFFVFLWLSVALVAGRLGSLYATEFAQSEAIFYTSDLDQPTYCDMSGPLTLEACALTNKVLAEDYYLRAVAIRYPATQRLQVQTKLYNRIKRKCDRVLAAAYKRNGDGTMNNVERQGCELREFHEAANSLTRRIEKPDVIPYNSNRAPKYCNAKGGLGFGCTFANLRLATDFMYRITSEKVPPDLTGEARTSMVKQAELKCTVTASHIKDKTDPASDPLADNFHCIHTELHKMAVQLLR